MKRNAAGEWTTYGSSPAPAAITNVEKNSEKAPTDLAYKKKKVDDSPLPMQPTLWSLGFKSKSDEPKRMEVRLSNGPECECKRVFKNTAGLIGHQEFCSIYKEKEKSRLKKMKDSITHKIKTTNDC